MKKLNLFFCKFQNRKVLAFTLIELLVAIAIVGVLSAFVFVSLSQAINTANDTKRKSDLSAIQKAILMYSVQNNQDLPSLDSDCDICDSCPGLAKTFILIWPNIFPMYLLIQKQTVFTNTTLFLNKTIPCVQF